MISAASNAKSSETRRIASWWKFRGEADIIELRPLQGTVNSLSIAGDELDIPKRFVSECKALGFEVLHLVDRSWGGYSTPNERKQTIERLVSSCLEKDFDGIDLDYENQPADSRDHYSALMNELSVRLRALGKKLSICVGYYAHNHDSSSDQGFIDPEAVERSCDEVRVMCYDQYFAPGKGREPFDRLDCQAIGATSTQPWARTAMRHWAASISRRKLVMGLPAYSNDYDANPQGFGRHIYTSLPPANNWIVDRTWLWFDKVNLYRYLDEQGAPHLFYASDAESTRAHLETAAVLGVSVISFWHGRSVSEAMWHEARQWREGP